MAPLINIPRPPLCCVLQCVSSGILVGSGKQKIAALCNLICYYCIGLPVGRYLMFEADLKILGIPANTISRYDKVLTISLKVSQYDCLLDIQ